METNDPDTPSLPYAGLRCPHCDYHLTGLPQPRCPECGNAFDPVLLRQIRDDVARPATPWDRRPDLAGFAQTWAMALVHPRRLAREFPSHYDAAWAWAYSGLCYGLSLLLLLLAGIGGEAELLFFVFGTALGAAVGCVLTEALIASMLSLLVRPTFVRKPYRFWRGLTHYTSGFTLLSALAGCVPTLGEAQRLVDPRNEDFFVFLTVGLALFAFVSWNVSLCGMVFERSRPGPRRMLACACVPVIGLGGICAGIVSAGFVALILWSL